MTQGKRILHGGWLGTLHPWSLQFFSSQMWMLSSKKLLFGWTPRLVQVVFAISQSLSLWIMVSTSLRQIGHLSNSLRCLLTWQSPTPMLLCKHCHMKDLIRGKVSTFQTQHPINSSSSSLHLVAKEYADLSSKSPCLSTYLPQSKSPKKKALWDGCSNYYIAPESTECLYGKPHYPFELLSKL